LSTITVLIFYIDNIHTLSANIEFICMSFKLESGKKRATSKLFFPVSRQMEI